MRTLIAFLLIGLSLPAMALRCGNSIVSEGDSYYKIIKNCTIEHEYVVNNAMADIKKLYINNHGMVYELVVIDGKLNAINRQGRL